MNPECEIRPLRGSGAKLTTCAPVWTPLQHDKIEESSWNTWGDAWLLMPKSQPSNEIESRALIKCPMDCQHGLMWLAYAPANDTIEDGAPNLKHWKQIEANGGFRWCQHRLNLTLSISSLDGYIYMIKWSIEEGANTQIYTQAHRKSKSNTIHIQATHTHKQHTHKQQHKLPLW